MVTHQMRTTYTSYSQKAAHPITTHTDLFNLSTFYLLTHTSAAAHQVAWGLWIPWLSPCCVIRTVLFDKAQFVKSPQKLVDSISFTLKARVVCALWLPLLSFVKANTVKKLKKANFLIAHFLLSGNLKTLSQRGFTLIMFCDCKLETICEFY